MLNFFKRDTDAPAKPATSPGLMLAPQPVPKIDFSAFFPGIDNVHIDVTLSRDFEKGCSRLVEKILQEFITARKRATDPPSDKLKAEFNKFKSGYSGLLETAIHRAAEGKRVDKIQLFQTAVIKFLLHSMETEGVQLLARLRNEPGQASSETGQSAAAREHAIRAVRQQPSLLSHAGRQLFPLLRWVENSTTGKLRESLLGVRQPIAEDMLFNLLLMDREDCDAPMQMKEYLLLNRKSGHPFSFARLDKLTDALLEQIAVACKVTVKKSSAAAEDDSFTWKDSLECMDSLFDTESASRKLEWSHDAREQAQFEILLKQRQKARKLLVKGLKQAQLLTHAAASYATVSLYPSFAYALKPHMVYEVLCGEMSLEAAYSKIEIQKRIRSRRAGDKSAAPGDLASAKKAVKRAAGNSAEDISMRFIKSFVKYRRDLKYRRKMLRAMERVHLLHDEADILLSKSNGMLQAFLQQDEYSDEDTVIRGYAVLKADIRGSTTMVDELRKRDLNPATHFSRNFFDPIRELIKTYGAEKVFIEGDAIILSLIEYAGSPEQWLSTARACGLAQSMLEVVKTQNEVCVQHHLPQLELGIGICYEDGAPTFLYDGDQRIMISPAIGKADRLSSCSWALRRKFARHNPLTKIMVFQQPEGTFKGEKGVTTLRYNLNGVELDPRAFAKLTDEITLQPRSVRLPGEARPVRFYTGRYPDVKGGFHNLTVREGLVKLWQEGTDQYPVTDVAYYEVMDPKVLQKRQ
ncbi:MAG: hypothetical protein GY862_34200 [Gammaproteobacteria bacterium]|nr:hypothetical protein [Gammaproteobacteria bacterium]